MKALKAVVVAMAVVLVAGFVALFVMWQDKRADRQAARAPAAARPAPEVVDGAVALPAGSRVVAVASAERVLDVLVENADGTRDVYQVGRDGGAVRGVLRFRPEAP